MTHDLTLAARRPGQACATSSRSPEPNRSSGEETAKLKQHLWERGLTEFGPLVVFFIALTITDIFWATGIFMVAVAVATAAGWWRKRRLPLVPIVNLVLLIAMGSATVLSQDPFWILVRPTIMNGVPGLLLLLSVAVRRPALVFVIGREARLSEQGWRALTVHVGLFLIGLAVINEVVWRAFGEEVWAAYKAFVFLPLNAVFIYSQWRSAQRYRLPPERRA